MVHLQWQQGLAEVRMRSSIKGRVGMQIQAWADARSCATAHCACNCLTLCNGRWPCSFAVHNVVNAAMHSCQRVQLLGGRLLPTCSLLVEQPVKRGEGLVHLDSNLPLKRVGLRDLDACRGRGGGGGGAGRWIWCHM